MGLSLGVRDQILGEARQQRGDAAQLNDAAYRSIREAIGSLRFQPGEELSAATLAEWLGMSRTPVREALQRLQHEGLVRAVRRRGLIVTELSAKDAEDLYEMQEALEGMAAKLAAERAGMEDRARLLELSREMLDAAVTGDVEAWQRVDRAFHEQIVAASGNAHMIRAADDLAARFQRFRLATVHLPGRIARSADEHFGVAEAIGVGDGTLAMQRTHAHWAGVRIEVLDYLRRHVYPMRQLGIR